MKLIASKSLQVFLHACKPVICHYFIRFGQYVSLCVQNMLTVGRRVLCRRRTKLPYECSMRLEFSISK